MLIPKEMKDPGNSKLSGSLLSTVTHMCIHTYIYILYSAISAQRYHFRYSISFEMLKNMVLNF